MRVKRYRSDVAIVVVVKDMSSMYTHWIKQLQQQDILVSRYIVLNLSGASAISDVANQAGFESYSVKPKTAAATDMRQLATSLCPDAKILVYLGTECDLSEPNFLDRLLNPLLDEQSAYSQLKLNLDFGAYRTQALTTWFKTSEQTSLRSYLVKNSWHTVTIIEDTEEQLRLFNLSELLVILSLCRVWLKRCYSRVLMVKKSLVTSGSSTPKSTTTSLSIPPMFMLSKSSIVPTEDH